MALTEDPLRPEDFDLALRRMKRELALTSLRRRLRDPGLDADAILGTVSQILALQAEEEREPRAADPTPAKLGLREILRIVAD